MINGESIVIRISSFNKKFKDKGMLKFLFKKNELNEIENNSLKNENKELQDELQKHKEFFESVYMYCGSYPNWKAQQEYRQIIQERRGDHFFQPTEPLDQFLGNLVDATQKLIQSSESIDLNGANPYFWNDGLSQARGYDIEIDWKNQ
jgi:hypothetical protein